MRPRFFRDRRQSCIAGFAFAAAILFALALASPVLADACIPSFPYRDGWMGGDGAFSIPLAPDRELWMFGDTFVSRPDQHKQTRVGSTMVANTIALSSCRAGKWSIEYHWRPPLHGHERTEKRDQRAFFDSRTRAFRYWPLDGFVYNKTLYVALLRVVNTNAHKPFGFKLVGVDLAKVANLDAAPDQWSIAYLPLSRSRDAFPGVSIVVQPPFVWMYAVMDRDRHKRQSVILTRLALERLDRPAESLEYLAAGGKLTPAPIRADAQDIVADGQSDFSVRYHSEIAKWVMVQQEPGFLTDEIGIRTAAALDGPWSPFQSLMHEPDLPGKTHRKCFCYAAKEHPSFESTPGTLVVTYVESSLHFHTVIHDMSVYRPIVTQLRMP
jgi:hypothetical protein